MSVTQALEGAQAVLKVGESRKQLGIGGFLKDRCVSIHGICWFLNETSFC